MAETLSHWVGDVQEAMANIHGTRMTRLMTSTHYNCRRRNNKADGKISEHGFANAIDITGVLLADGRKVTVAGDREDESDLGTGKSTENERVMRLLHAKACKYFTTVLGPQSDPQHADHFHFDLGCHGSKCTYKICQ